eukprot:TRINITY_DN27410_c0_g1_i1.p2 TRINITY_DN27410_c0_g1~~TRINITY_DN27410_c0_g1_i1.p2  ORF type:complete len:209 (-),score=59.27 TRINITY_DN27410_c0_g1_i1:193-819(-)
MVDSPAMLSCKLQMMNGELVTLEAQAAWKIKNLRNHIQKQLSIPTYEQVLTKKGQVLHNDLVLVDLCSETSQDCLELSVARSLKPEGISECQAEFMWDCFLVSSHDGGLTVDATHASKIARHAVLNQVASAIKRQDDIPASFDFAELLWYFSALQESLAQSAPRLVVEHHDIFDTGRTNCPRMGALNFGAEDDSDSSEESDEEDSDED